MTENETEAEMFDAAEWFDVVMPAESRYFASGSNRAPEVRGLVMSGMNVGVSAPEIGPSTEAELATLAGGPTQVFIDSGAFGEIDFKNGPPKVKKLITEVEWGKRLAKYKRLATVLGSQLYCVAPDMVAFQKETLERLTKYAPVMKELMELGANVIVPVQKGELSMAEFAERAAAILGTEEVIWGIPSKKDATSIEDVTEFATHLWLKAKPTRVHLLGLGPQGKRYMAVYNAVVLNSPWTTVFSDSVRIAAMAGNGTVRKDGTRKPRVLTAAQNAVVAEAAAQGKTVTVFEKVSTAMTRVMRAEGHERVQEARRRGWWDPELESAPGVPYLLEDGTPCLDYGPGGPFGGAA